MKKAFALLVLLALPALARVGGGESYSGSSHDSGGGYSGGGGGGSGDGQAVGLLIELLIRLIFFYPQIGIPLIIVAAIAYWQYVSRNGSVRDGYQQLSSWAQERPRSARPASPPDLDRLRAVDPNFSRPLFLDFLGLLYSRTYLLRGEAMGAVGAYLASPLRHRLQDEPSCQRVIIGGMRIAAVELDPGEQRVAVEVEANLEGAPGAHYVVDRMMLRRGAGVLTAAPENVYSLACPNCGSSEPVDENGRCTACQESVNDGRFGWLLVDLQRLKTEPRVEVSLAQSERQTTGQPSLVSPGLEQALMRLRRTDPGFTPEGLETLAVATFTALQQAWTSGSWQLARPLESDYLFGQHQLWLEAYAREGLRNVLEEIQVTRVELVRLESDRYFDSATLRMFARMKDSTVRVSDGKLLAGDPHRARAFSEYWTFVRRAGVSSQQRDAVCCPNCGAALDRVTVAGVCEYCDANITRGDYDWVLSRIEQVEAYR